MVFVDDREQILVGKREDIGEVGEGEKVIRIYCIKFCFFKRKA